MLGLAAAVMLQAAGAPTEPAWRPVVAPKGEVRFYPSRAQRAEIEGEVVMECVVTPEGRPLKCRILSETPAGWEFGEATFRLAHKFKVRPDATSTVTPDGPVARIPMRFKRPPK
jgi:protein TonB